MKKYIESEIYTISRGKPAVYVEKYETSDVDQVVGYKYATAIVYGYGNTPQESLQDCINNFNYLQKKYNKENISF